MPIAYIFHPDCLLHDVGQEHPENPSRLWAINDLLISSGMDFALQQFEAPIVTREQLERVHDSDYVTDIIIHAPHEGFLRLDDDTTMTPHTLDAARRAAGAVVLGVDMVMEKRFRSAFCAVRPPGHHAEHDKAMGFCYFNNVAVGAAHALEAHGLERVAIIDFDVHHGNGTENIFQNDPRVMFCSSFQHPFYPFSGHDTVSDHIINLPLPGGTNGEEFRRQVATKWLPALDDFAPQMILISAGFDAHAEDSLGQMRLRESDYKWITAELMHLADTHAEGRIVSVLEGGYELGALARSVIAHLNVLLGNEI